MKSSPQHLKHSYNFFFLVQNNTRAGRCPCENRKVESRLSEQNGNQCNHFIEIAFLRFNFVYFTD